MRASVRLQVKKGDVRELGPGDIIGRGWTCNLVLPDPWVSEAHAMVSLRDGALKLLGLRGRFMVAGQNLTEATLAPGMLLALSASTTLLVTEVEVPDHVLAIEHPAFGRRVLSGVHSIVTSPRPALLAGADPAAAAIIWGDGLDWFARAVGADDVRLVPGAPLVLGTTTFQVVAVAVAAAAESTSLDARRVDEPLLLVNRYDTIHIHRGHELVLTLDGIVARIVSDLASAGVPMGWNLIAADLWPGETDTAILRRNWDAALARLRRKLRDARIRTDLVRSDYGGNFEIVLHRGDRIDDQT